MNFVCCRMYVEDEGTVVRKLYITGFEKQDEGVYKCTGMIEGNLREKLTNVFLFSRPSFLSLFPLYLSPFCSSRLIHLTLLSFSPLLSSSPFCSCILTLLSLLTHLFLCIFSICILLYQSININLIYYTPSRYLLRGVPGPASAEKNGF